MNTYKNTFAFNRVIKWVYGVIDSMDVASEEEVRCNAIDAIMVLPI